MIRLVVRAYNGYLLLVGVLAMVLRLRYGRRTVWVS